MADRGSLPPGIRLDIQQLQSEAKHRWLRPAEICEILRNYQKFQISTEPPNQPSSGSLFLFDRKVLRYFRKDGHNWRKKKDGKTVKEAHEKLKVGSVDVLHCYYAHGEDNECFQRRSYWLLEEEYMHIVFVHYLEVKGNRSNIREAESVRSGSQISNSMSSSVSNSYNEAFTGNTGSPSAVSSLTSSYEDIESEDSLQAMSKYPSPHNFTHVENNIENNISLMGSSYLPTYPDEYKGVQPSGLDYVSITQGGPVACDNQFRTLDLASWEELLQQCTSVSGNSQDNPLTSVTPFGGSTVGVNENFSQVLDAGFGVNSALSGSLSPFLQNNNSLELSSTEFQDNTNISVTAKQPLVGNIKAEEGLQKVDSFSKWMTKELAGVDDLHLKSSSNLSWQNIETTTAVDDPSIQLEVYTMSPSIGQDQLFDIQDFSPSCASTNGETKVIITGKFLLSPSEVFKYKWSCMFGEVEVPADVFGNGVLCCYAPSHSAGQVPFYITCSNRFACSQVREFEYLEESMNEKYSDVRVNSMTEKQLCHRLHKLLSLRSTGNFDPSENIRKKEPIFRNILLLMDDELCRGVEQHLKEKVVAWLFDKVSEDGKGPSVLDEEGQGLLHLAAALGYDWIIPPTLASGVIVNFRDINGWTALHWAAFYGREETVALLVALEAASGALTDPSPEYPLGRTAADLASANGYKGISGFLAEHSITKHLETLTMTDQKVDTPVADSTSKAVQTMKEKVATPSYEGDGADLSLKDSLAAVRNATQAAGRIHQVFRMQSFQRKQVIKDTGDDESLLSDEQFLSLVSSKIKRPGRHDEQFHSAALSIQKKYRGWKKRKEFLIIRERVVRIQAHVRGHQVRKRYQKVVWTVGILEKVILRWRRKGTGLRGFRSDNLNKAASPQVTQEEAPSKLPEDDDYDYLKEGRKQTEERLQKALVRVKSMVQYPEGRAQYRRLLTAVEGFQKNQVQENIVNSSENVPVEGEEDMIDVESLLDDDNFMAMAFE